MPKFKEVVLLQTMVLDLFIESVIQCCNRLSEANDRDLFRSGVIAIRTAVHRYLPGPLLAEFGNKFFEKFHLQRFDKLDYQVGLEMIMDIKIVGLRLKGHNLWYLNLREGQRFSGLEELDLSPVRGWNLVGEEIYRYLPTFNTNFLTKFVHHRWCDDDGLAIIGQQCQNLEVLKISGSEHVTDEGLRALSPCSNLRCVHFRRCPRVSHQGLNHLLSAHEKLEDFYYEPFHH